MEGRQERGRALREACSNATTKRALAGHLAIETESRDLRTIDQGDDTRDRVSPYRSCHFGMLISDMTEPHIVTIPTQQGSKSDSIIEGEKY